MRILAGNAAICEAMKEEMLRDEKVFLMGEDVAGHGGMFGTSVGLLSEFGSERIIDTPISESAIIGAGLGAAITGMRPISELMFVDFAACAMDQIANQVAKVRFMSGGRVKVPLTIRTNLGGYINSAAQHSQSLEAWFMHIPGLKIAIPSTPYDAKGLLKTAIRDDNPVMFLEHKLLFNLKGEVPETEYLIPFGAADIKKVGSDVTIVATSFMVQKSLEAAAKLEKEGISVEVVDPRTLVPLDEDTIIESVTKTGKVVVVQEANSVCGVSAQIASMIMKKAFKYLDAPVERVGSKPIPIPYGSILENACLPQVEDIEKAVKTVMSV